MKKVLFSLIMVMATVAAIAQSAKYQDAMGGLLKTFSTGNTPEALQITAAAFERIGNAEKNQWLPYYYAALAKLRMGYMDAKADKDAIAKQVDALIATGESINKNAEFSALKYMNATLQLIVSPMERFMKYGTMAEEAFQEGIKQDANNPRLYYLKARTLQNTPPQFGGGFDRARPLYEKAVELGKVKPADPLMPDWGAEDAQKILNEKK